MPDVQIKKKEKKYEETPAEEQLIKKEKKNEEIPIEDIRELMSMANKELPLLIKGLFSSLYDVETAEQYAKGIATIYKTLNEQGLPKEMIDQLVMKYADSINILGNALKKVNIKKKAEDSDED